MRHTLNVASIALAAFDAVCMSGAGVMRVKKLKGNNIIVVAARHNRRVIQAELGATGSIDPTRSCLNETLIGPLTAADVGRLAKAKMAAAGVVKLRKDAVMSLEFVFSLPPGHAIDDRAYFTACAAWVGATFGGAQNVLSVDIHRDESQPHCHVLALPLINGRMIGNKLIGGKQQLMALHKDFHAKVAALYGLNKAPARLIGTTKQAAAKAVLQKLQETSDGALQSAVWAVIREAVERDPAPFMSALDIELKAAAKKLKPFVDYVTSKGKGPLKELNAIAFASPANDRRLCSVAFTSKPPVSLPADPTPRPAPKAKSAPQPPANNQAMKSIDGCNIETVRTKDNDLDPALYDLTTGEYFQRPPPLARNQRQAADAWVAAALMTV